MQKLPITSNSTSSEKRLPSTSKKEKSMAEKTCVNVEAMIRSFFSSEISPFDMKLAPSIPVTFDIEI